jgi:hypothetical protein
MASHSQPGLTGALYRTLKDLDVRKIADAALEVLARSGMAVHAESTSRTSS